MEAFGNFSDREKRGGEDATDLLGHREGFIYLADVPKVLVGREGPIRSGPRRGKARRRLVDAELMHCPHDDLDFASTLQRVLRSRDKL